MKDEVDIMNYLPSLKMITSLYIYIIVNNPKGNENTADQNRPEVSCQHHRVRKPYPPYSKMTTIAMIESCSNVLVYQLFTHCVIQMNSRRSDTTFVFRLLSITGHLRLEVFWLSQR